MNARHKWRTRGKDNLGASNIWRCSVCSLFKCEHWPTDQGNPEYEYTTPAGEVLVRGRRPKIKIPSCASERYIGQ